MKDEVERVALPEGSLVLSAFERPDYADAYRIRIRSPHLAEVDAYTYALLSNTPDWVETLMRTRDRAAGMIGLKTAPHQDKPLPSRFVAGVDVGLFRVFGRSDEEILLGQDDRHLDFRFSVFRQQDDEDVQYMVVSTVVQMNNLLGRAYFVPVRLFHRSIVKAMMRAAQPAE